MTNSTETTFADDFDLWLATRIAKAVIANGGAPEAPRDVAPLRARRLARLSEAMGGLL